MRLTTAVAALFCASLSASASFGQDFSNFDYRNVGPTRGGRVTAVAGTVAAPGTFYLGGSGAGVWKTTDYGQTWNPVSDEDFATPSIGDIAIAQNDANIVYVGTGSDGLRSNVIVGKGVYKSVNGGQSWSHLGLEKTGHIGAVEIDPTNHNVVWVAAIGQAFQANEERGVYKTENGGKTWEKVLYHSDTVGFTDVELLPGNPEIAFASAWKAERKPWTIISGGPAEDAGIWKTVDGGDNWTKITEGLPTGLTGKIDLGISTSNSKIVYALVEAPPGIGGLYKSVDQGETFELVSNKKELVNRPFYYTNVEVDPTDPDTVYVMATQYWKSTDGGTSWTEMRPPHGDNHDMWIHPENPDHFIQGNDGGATITFNGGKTWSTQFNQPTVEVYQVEVDDQYPYWLYGGQQDNGTTISVPSMASVPVQHKVAYLMHTGGCETGPAVPKPGNHNIVYANCKGRFGVFDKRTGHEKAYWVGAVFMYGHNPKDLPYRFQRVAPIHVSPHNPDVVYHASQYVHRTTDDGKTWEKISPDLTAFEPDKQVISGSPITRDITGEEIYSTIYSLRESPVQAGVIWSGANDGPVHVTRDNGKSWTKVTPKGLPKGGRVDSISPSHHAAGKAYISVLRYQLGDWKPYIYRTGNFGQSWTLLTNGKNGIPADTPVRVVREDPEREGLLFAGTEFGVYVSLDDGKTWSAFQQNLPVTPVTDIKIHRGDLVLSTMGRSFWVLDDITALRQSAFDALDDSMVLFAPKPTYRYRTPYRNDGTAPDYPRAFVAVDYYLPEGGEGPVRLDVLDAEGAIVNAYTSETAAPDDSATGPQRDMGSEQITYIVDESLGADAGMNRFRWDMTHRGPWHPLEARRYRNGPVAAPGTYTLRLSQGDTVVTQTVELRADPRVIEHGTTLEDMEKQVALLLDIRDMLDEAGQLTADLEAEHTKLMDLKAAGTLGADQSARMKTVATALTSLKTKEEGFYQQPMLAAQIGYLYSMLDDADQVPGRDAYERAKTLEGEMKALKDSLGMDG
ncbi:MAG: WD40/YVTN/BNR-like repeat-containing protein [Alphaproteobacteria bacterium]